jgi:hypothetical protein
MSDKQLSSSAWLRLSYYHRTSSCSTLLSTVRSASSPPTVQILIHRQHIAPTTSVGFPSLAIVLNAARGNAAVLKALRERNLLEGFEWAVDAVRSFLCPSKAELMTASHRPSRQV